jgi:hypothetical protein
MRVELRLEREKRDEGGHSKAGCDSDTLKTQGDVNDVVSDIVHDSAANAQGSNNNHNINQNNNQNNNNNNHDNNVSNNGNGKSNKRSDGARKKSTKSETIMLPSGLITSIALEFGILPGPELTEIRREIVRAVSLGLIPGDHSDVKPFLEHVGRYLSLTGRLR